jgi:hypothetical protein
MQTLKIFQNMRLTITMKWCMAIAFMLVASTVFAQPGNDACSDAIALSCGDVVSGSTTGATADEVPACAPQSTGPSVWYTVTGTGGEITVSTCSPATDYNTQLAVYAGTCNDLACIGGNNVDFTCAASARNSTFTFMSLAGATYYIYVTGQGGANGTYELSVDCNAIPIENDDCADAEPISCGDVVTGSTAGASNASLPFCGTSLSSGPGVWYELTGDGSLVTATTCGAGTNYDTKLGVFSGSCGALSCVGGDDDDFGCGFSSLQSVVEFSTTPGETYYIYVTGFGSGSGDFELSVTCESAATNDDVCGALPLSIGATPFSLSTASVQAGEPSPGPGTGSSSCNSTDGWCSFETDVDASLWYTFVAPASGCVDIVLDGGDSQMAIWSVGDCSDFSTFTEVFANDDGGPGLAAGLEDMLLTPGETYYLQVDDYGGGPTFASGNINFNEGDGCDIPPPAQPTCDTAIDIDCGDQIAGSTTGAPINDLGDCNGEDLGEAEGVWYTVQGNGLGFSVETLQEGTDYDPVIGVFEGSCDALSCVTANNNATLTTRMARVEWVSTPGVTYYVYITGQRGADGNFLFSVDCFVPNDDCSGAIAIDCNSTVSGNNELASSDSAPFCGTSVTSGKGVWYSFTGSGTETTVSTCNPGTNFDTKVLVYEGSCESLSCVAGNDDDCGLQSSVTFESTEGVTYYVLVTGFSSFSDGDFVLSLSCAAPPPPPGGGCEISTMECGDVVSGTTVGANIEDPGTCGTTLGSAPGVFYRFIGTGDNVEVTTCNAGSDFDTKLGVFSGSCDDLTCVGGDDDDTCPFSGLRSRVEFFGEPGVVYYIYVTGFGSNTGNYELSLTCTPAMVNQDCANADELFCGDIITDSTVGANVNDLGTCVTALGTAPGVFYKFTGTGDNVEVTTCNAGSDYDTKLGVFEGSCLDLICVTGNDDATCSFSGLRSTVNFFAAAGTDYFIYVTGFGGGNGTYEISVDCNTNLMVDPDSYGNTTIADALDAEIQVGNPYPNPTQTGQATIDIQLPKEGTSHIRIFDQLGRLMQQTEVDMFAGTNRVDLDVANLTAGTYFVNITIDGEQFMKKLAIVR